MRTTKEERVCPVCGTRFWIRPNQAARGKGKYCSVKCGALGRRGKIEQTCEVCGKPFFVKPCEIKRNKGRFCSKKCRYEANSGSLNPAWNGGVSFEPYCPRFNERLKEYIRQKFNRKCVLCGISENGVKLSVHHVDYNKLQGCKGHTWALVSLCSSCHSKTGYNRWYYFLKLFNYWALTSDIKFESMPFCDLCMDATYRGI